MFLSATCCLHLEIGVLIITEEQGQMFLSATCCLCLEIGVLIITEYTTIIRWSTGD